jgi:glycosyltransferase involved in cell wall biosynthesis
LARHGVEVTTLFDAAEATRPAPFGADAVAVEHAVRGSLRFPMHLEDAIAGADVVVLHGGWLLGNVVAGRVCRGSGVPFVITSHGVYVQEVLSRRPVRKRVWQALFERRHLEAATAIHVFFDEERASMESAMGIHAPTILAPNGIDFPEHAAWSGRGGFLLWLGRFDITTKGLDLLAHAIERIPAAQRPQVRLHGPDWRNGKKQMNELVRRLGIGAWVSIGDPVYGDEKWSLIGDAGACIYPSRWDACPVAVSEAAAVGAPTLVARYPLGSFLAARDAALQVDPDPLSIADAIPRLLSSDSHELGKAASIVARTHLSWHAVATSWLKQLRGMLAK